MTVYLWGDDNPDVQLFRPGMFCGRPWNGQCLGQEVKVGLLGLSEWGCEFRESNIA